MQTIVVGPLPPPVHGMATTNAAVCDALEAKGATILAINTASASLHRSRMNRLRRSRKVLSALFELMRARKETDTSLYMSLSGGWGQLYEVGLLLVGRFRRMRIYMRHCSYAYLDKPTWLTRFLVAAAGSNAVHITQSPGMGDRLRHHYGIKRVIPISNAVLYGEASLSAPQRTRVAVVGFLSNVSAEKGICDFLDLLEETQRRGLPVSGKIAGGFDDDRIRKYVLERLGTLEHVEYVGPVHGTDKEAFFSSVDIFVFPTRYKNETEAKVNHEAMSRGIPVIAYGRGCIPEIVDETCGLVIDPEAPFVSGAIRKIERWLSFSAEFQAASCAASARFSRTKKESEERWHGLIGELMGEGPGCVGSNTGVGL